MLSSIVKELTGDRTAPGGYAVSRLSLCWNAHSHNRSARSPRPTEQLHRVERPTRWNVFLPISMPIVSTRVALIDVAWDILLVLLISRREVYASPGRSAAIGLGVPPNA